MSFNYNIIKRCTVSLGFGLDDTQCVLRASNRTGSLLRELFETSDSPTEPDYSMFPKPQLSTVNVSYICQEFPTSKAVSRPNTQCEYDHEL